MSFAEMIMMENDERGWVYWVNGRKKGGEIENKISVKKSLGVSYTIDRGWSTFVVSAAAQISKPKKNIGFCYTTFVCNPPCPIPIRLTILPRFAEGYLRLKRRKRSKRKG
ncbi:hypothetical protein CHUAL_014071 [Chamberlinius hualienensis]